jgi:hypothetical protein
MKLKSINNYIVSEFFMGYDIFAGLRQGVLLAFGALDQDMLVC